MNKAEQRALALLRRRSLGPELRREYSRLICLDLLTLPQVRAARLVLSYMASGSETDLTSLHAALGAAGVRLAFPISGEGGIMEAWEPENAGAFRRGAFGILEPDPARARRVAPEEIDLVLVPCVAFDGGCMRLGHGAGYYDRFLPRCKKALRVAAAFEAQRLEEVSAGEHDVPMDLVVTEKRRYHKEDDETY